MEFGDSIIVFTPPAIVALVLFRGTSPEQPVAFCGVVYAEFRTPELLLLFTPCKECTEFVAESGVYTPIDGPNDSEFFEGRGVEDCPS